MKILYIITQGEQGGAQTSISDLRKKMSDLGHEVLVTTGRVHGEKDRWLSQDFVINSLEREINLVKDVKAIYETYKLIKKIDPDVVHLHSSKAGLVGSIACFLARKKSVYTVHGFVFLEPMSSLKKQIFIFIEFFTSFFRDFTILISENDLVVGKRFSILRGNVDKEYSLIYNGLDEKIKDEMLDKQSALDFLLPLSDMGSKTPGLSGGVKVVGTIANWYKTKGLEYFIQAAGEVVTEFESGRLRGEHLGRPQTPPIFLVLGGGDEKYKQELETLIVKNNLQNNFFLLGKVPDARKYLKALDLFVLASVKEGLPYCLLEAKMAGLPVVATSVGGIPSMSENFYIDLVETKNVEELKNKIIKNLLNPVQVDDKLPEIYKLENMIKETENFYQKVLC